MAIREAFALGVPVAGSHLGSIPCIVETHGRACCSHRAMRKTCFR